MVLMVMTQCLACPCAALASPLFSSAAVHQHCFAVQVAQLQDATAVDFGFGAGAAADADTDTDVFDSTDAPTTVISA